MAAARAFWPSLRHAPERTRGHDRLARQCGYAWAEGDALFLLADAWWVLGEPRRAVDCCRDAEALAARLRIPAGG